MDASRRHELGGAARGRTRARACFGQTRPARGDGSSRRIFLAPLLSLAVVAARIKRPLEMIKKAIAAPAGEDGHYAPWQFTALAALLEARDKVKTSAGGRFRQAVRCGLAGSSRARSPTIRPTRPARGRRRSSATVLGAQPWGEPPRIAISCSGCFARRFPLGLQIAAVARSRQDDRPEACRLAGA